VLARAANADGSLRHGVSAFLKKSNILGTHSGRASQVVIPAMCTPRAVNIYPPDLKNTGWLEGY